MAAGIKAAEKAAAMGKEEMIAIAVGLKALKKYPYTILALAA